MPQMAPIWWFTLFLMFISTYYIFVMISYFFNIYKMKMENPIKTNAETNTWKW